VIIAFAVRPMWLMVVILDKTPMSLFCPFPSRHLLKMIITHPSHNRDYVELPLVALSKTIGVERQVHIITGLEAND